MLLLDVPDVSTSRPLAARKVGSIGDSIKLVRIVCADDREDNTAAESLTIAEVWVGRACQLLEIQWPRQSLVDEDQMSSYRYKIVHDSPVDVVRYGLPCSYLLVKNDLCVGHGRLTECFENAGGNAAAVTFVVIDSLTRGQGLGTYLMQLLEEEAKRLGYHYVYLWTSTAILFYEKLGYKECHRVSLKRACLKALDGSQVEGLEALLLRKNRGRSDVVQKPKMTETITLTRNDCDVNAKDVWMRKRLVEYVGSHKIASSERLEELRTATAAHQESQVSSRQRCRFFLHSIPWQAQIGPSCGLAALRMVRDYYFSHRQTMKSGESSEDSAPPLPSLLTEAQARGYTIDGEVFDANHLMRLAMDVCGLDCEMKATKTLRLSTIWNELRQGGVWILPYDSNQRTRLPGCFQGKNAHYGIIVGLSIGFENESVPEYGTGNELQTLQQCAKDQCDTLGSYLDQADTGGIKLLLQHSLSKKLSVACLNDFLDSNLQLETVDCSKFGTKHLDLKNRIILCRGVRSDAF